jgi:pSer/pThr/pTyr-binding forkhead associated (FHA) protein
VTGGFVVRDLGSTNGTYVNGERVAERQLTPGDRVQIGSNTITFCHVTSALEGEGGEDQTLLAERPTVSESFQGDLAEIPPFAVLQVLELGRKSGVLHIETPEGPGRLWLFEGAPIHAETKSRVGFEAALAIADTSAGRFAFEAGGEVPNPTIEASVTELLLEASRLQDERER